jgi:hypothetical protein
MLGVEAAHESCIMYGSEREESRERGKARWAVTGPPAATGRPREARRDGAVRERNTFRWGAHSRGCADRAGAVEKAGERRDEPCVGGIETA